MSNEKSGDSQPVHSGPLSSTRRSFLHDILINAGHFSGTDDSISALINGVRNKK